MNLRVIFLTSLLLGYQPYCSAEIIKCPDLNGLSTVPPYTDLTDEWLVVEWNGPMFRPITSNHKLSAQKTRNGKLVCLGTNIETYMKSDESPVKAKLRLVHHGDLKHCELLSPNSFKCE